jgi:hypothetical protein
LGSAGLSRLYRGGWAGAKGIGQGKGKGKGFDERKTKGKPGSYSLATGQDNGQDSRAVRGEHWIHYPTSRPSVPIRPGLSLQVLNKREREIEVEEEIEEEEIEEEEEEEEEGVCHTRMNTGILYLYGIG